MLFHQQIKRKRSTRGTFKFCLRAIPLDVESFSNQTDTLCNLSGGNPPAQRRKLVYLDDLDMRSKDLGLQRQIGVDVEHAAVIVAHHTQAVVFHGMSHS